MLDWLQSAGRGAGRWWGGLSPAQQVGWGGVGLQGALGLLGFLQGMQRPRPTRTMLPGPTPAEQQLQALYQQRAAAIPTPQAILADPRIRETFGQAFSGAGSELARKSLENLRARGFQGGLEQLQGMGQEYNPAMANLQSEVNRAMLNYALQAPGAEAQALAPAGDLLKIMATMRGAQAYEQKPKPTFLNALGNVAAPLQGGMQTLQRMYPFETKPTTAPVSIAPPQQIPLPRPTGIQGRQWPFGPQQIGSLLGQQRAWPFGGTTLYGGAPGGLAAPITQQQGY